MNFIIIFSNLKKIYLSPCRTTTTQDLIPVTIEVNIPFEFHPRLIGSKGEVLRAITDAFEVFFSYFIYFPDKLY